MARLEPFDLGLHQYTLSSACTACTVRAASFLCQPGSRVLMLRVRTRETCEYGGMCFGTVRLRGMETALMEPILTFASVSLKKVETDLLGSWWP
jgi:hypothetical protein